MPTWSTSKPTTAIVLPLYFCTMSVGSGTGSRPSQNTCNQHVYGQSTHVQAATKPASHELDLGTRREQWGVESPESTAIQWAASTHQKIRFRQDSRRNCDESPIIGQSSAVGHQDKQRLCLKSRRNVYQHEDTKLTWSGTSRCLSAPSRRERSLHSCSVQRHQAQVRQP